jgi:hypothetical protein
MNILLVAEKYSFGGLETHIKTLGEELSKNNNVWYCFGSFENKVLSSKRVFSDFNFKYDCTIGEFEDDVNKLIKIIKDKKIDLIHVHPFHSLFSALFAANITNTKIIYTYHGTSSINFCNNINDSILYYYGLESTLCKVLCVNTDGIDAYKSIGYSNAMWFPNCINLKEFKEIKVIYNRKWALISRLDEDKKNEIIKFIDFLKGCMTIDMVDIYGDGVCKKEIEDYIKKNKLEKRINFCGYVSSINTSLDNKYNGIIGAGRVALEGLTMGFPVLLICHGKIGGLINKTNYKIVSKHNFVTDNLEEIDNKELEKQLNNVNDNVSDYILMKNAIKDFDISKQVYEYQELMKKINFVSDNTWEEIYNNICKINQKDDYFYSSKTVYSVLEKFIASRTLNPYLRNIFIISNHLNNQFDYLNDEIYQLKQKVSSLEKKHRRKNEED